MGMSVFLIAYTTDGGECTFVSGVSTEWVGSVESESLLAIVRSQVWARSRGDIRERGSWYLTKIVGGRWRREIRGLRDRSASRE